LSGVAEQTLRYLDSIRRVFPISMLLPLCLREYGVETYFRDLRDPDFRSRRIFAFHQPNTLNDWIVEEDTVRDRLKELPPLVKPG